MLKKGWKSLQKDLKKMDIPSKRLKHVSIATLSKVSINALEKHLSVRNRNLPLETPWKCLISQERKGVWLDPPPAPYFPERIKDLGAFEGNPPEDPKEFTRADTSPILSEASSRDRKMEYFCSGKL